MHARTKGQTPPSLAHPATGDIDSGYAWYVLAVMMLVYMFNYLDRQILAILAEDVKKNLSITDSQLGFLFGTSFGVFYALFGYPLGRLVDRCRRVPLLAVGLVMWSLMTSWCGLTRTFGQLAVARIGVGIGEATGSPCAYSLLSDWFSKAKRGTALGLYAGGMYIGSGLSLAIGGMIVLRWDSAFAAGHAPFGLAGWQAAFLAVGLPGTLLALWVSTLREPKRGLADGIDAPVETRIFARFFDDLASVVPPFTVIQAARDGTDTLVRNLLAAGVAALFGWIAIRLSGDILQWTAIAIGCYAVFSSQQALRLRDRPTHALTWGTPAFVLVTIGFASVSLMNATIGFWVAPLSLRALGVDKATTGMILGATAALGGLLGVVVGGRVSDILLRSTPVGRLWVGTAAALIPTPFLIAMCLTKDPWIYYLCNVPVMVIGNAWVGAGAATVQELVLPRMRGTATAIYLVAITIIGLGLGPYMIGKASTVFGDLGTGLLFVLLAVPVSLACFLFAGRRLRNAEVTKMARAIAVGEQSRLT